MRIPTHRRTMNTFACTMPYEFIDELVMVIGVAERCCGRGVVALLHVGSRPFHVGERGTNRHLSLTSLSNTSNAAGMGSAMGPEVSFWVGIGVPTGVLRHAPARV
jgi:hypothetical protein